MKLIRLLLIPTTVAWFLGAFWWFGNNTSHKFTSSAGGPVTPSGASIIHLGPAPQGNVDGDTIVPASASADPAFARVLVIPFVKNKEEPAFDEAGQTWCATVRDHLNAHPEAFITVTGHTDADGDPGLNMKLSLQRAEIVKAQLIELGLPADRITTEGMGAYEPIADNTTSTGKALNRRVEIRVLP